MEERIVILTKFSQLLRNEILDYYDKTHLYLKDLVSYKNIDLNGEISRSDHENIKNNLKLMLKAVKTGLNTIGVPINKLTKIQNEYFQEIETKRTDLYNYGTFLEIYLNHHIDKLLFEILIDYLLDLDKTKIETLKLFKLIHQGFIDKLLVFKDTYLNSKTKTFFHFPEIEEHLNLTDLSINIKSYHENPKKIPSNTMKKEKGLSKEEEKPGEELNILAQLEEAKKDFIETLKTPKKELLPTPSPIQNNSETPTYIQRELVLEGEKIYFLDYFGNLPIVHNEFLNKFRINISNLLNSRIVNPDFLDLETMFYHISILKLAGIKFPFAPIEILDFLRNYITGMTFSSSKNIMPDSISIFYGLSIISELNLIHRTNIINLTSTEEFLKKTLNEIIPEKLKSNYFTLLGLKLLAKSEVITSRKSNLINQILGLNLLSKKDFFPVLDIYNQISILKILDKNIDLSRFNMLYVDELKKKLTSRGSIGDLITNSARTLLILDLLDLKEQESILCSRLLNYIVNSTDFFSLENLDKDFNWRIDKLAYKVELRMLFWALLACSQYSPDHLINL
ncbi:MAG: hypothetical protein ACFE8B_02880 [Candidatus Hermodarchaeota archaeon]